MLKKKGGDKPLDDLIDELDIEIQRREKEYGDLVAMVKEQQKAIEGFRVSFQNLDTKIKNLIERNRLR